MAWPSGAQQNTDSSSLPQSPGPYLIGERLTYNVSFSNFGTAAHLEMFVAGRCQYFGRDAIELRGRVLTPGVVYAALVSINSDFVSYVDAASGLPFHVKQIDHVSSSGQETVAEYNQGADTSTNQNQAAGNDPPGIYDLLSAIYRARALPLAEGNAYYFNIRNGGQDYRVELRIHGRQAVRTSVGTFNALVGLVRFANNSPANDYRIQIYFSDDEHHVPVVITARAQAGEIRAELAGEQIVHNPTPRPSPVRSPLATTTPEPVRPRPTPLATNRNSAPPPDTTNEDPLRNLPFKIGEQLNYRAYLPGMSEPVGNITFQVRGHQRYFDHDGLMFTAFAQTSAAVQRLFIASDQIASYVDSRTLLPFRCEMRLVEGRRQTNDILTLNQDYGNATNQAGRRIDIPIGTHDYVSIFYAMRSMDLTPPRRNAFSILINGKPHTLAIQALKRETIKMGSESVAAIQLQLTVPDDSQPDRYVLRGWISDDARRLPLRLTANTQLGELRVDLVTVPLAIN